MANETLVSTTPPDIGTLLQNTMDEYGKNIGAYAMAGVGHLLYSIPVVLVSLFAMYLVLLVYFVMVGTAFASTANTAPSQDMGGFIFLGVLSYFGVLVFVLIGMTSLINLMMAPINASLLRAVAKQQRGEEQLTIGSCFTTATQDLVPVLGVSLAISVLGSLLSLFCILPGLLVPLFFGFATSLVALHQARASDAMKIAAAHARGHLGWHAMYMVLHWVFTMLANNIPVLGPTFIAAFHVQATKALFGDILDTAATTD